LTRQASSPLTSSGIWYAWRQLFSRAGVPTTDDSNFANKLGVLARYGSHTWGDASTDCCIEVLPCSAQAWQLLLTTPPGHLDWLPTLSILPGCLTPLPKDQVPILFWGEAAQGNDKPFAERVSKDTVLFYVDIIATTFFMLSRWEEVIVPDRDEHDRFPATASVAYKQGFLDRPIVDEYALILREWVKVLLPGWEPKPRMFSIKLSHDIDFVQRIPGALATIRRAGGDVLKRRSLAQVGRTLWLGINDAASAVLVPEQNSYLRSIYFLAELSHKYGLESTFYFLVSHPGDPFSDTGCNPELPWVKQCMEDLQQMGFEVGLHPSYDTLQNPEMLAAEKATLDKVLGHACRGGRQHFLRFRAPDTWRHWEQVGLTYDSTITYADHEGFRCGTCHPFRPFDVVQDRELDLWEYPLIVMDGTLHDYRGLTPEQGEARILELAQRCKQVEGTFTLLWHNTSLEGRWQPWAVVYRRVLPHLAAMQTTESKRIEIT